MTIGGACRSLRVSRLALVLCAGLTLGACVQTVNTRGYLADEDIIADLIPGVDNRDSVQAALGSPSNTGTFNEDIWYYYSRRTKSVAFLRPKIVNQQILAVTFDEEGNVEEINRFTLADARIVELVKRETPTRGRELGLLEQLFGNIGRFSNQRQTSVPGQ